MARRPAVAEQFGEGVALEHVLDLVEQQQGAIAPGQQPLPQIEGAQPRVAPDRIAVLVGVIDLVQFRAHRFGQHGGVLGLAHAGRAVQQQVGAGDFVCATPRATDRRPPPCPGRDAESWPRSGCAGARA